MGIITLFGIPVTAAALYFMIFKPIAYFLDWAAQRAGDVHAEKKRNRIVRGKPGEKAGVVEKTTGFFSGLVYVVNVIVGVFFGFALLIVIIALVLLFIHG